MFTLAEFRDRFGDLFVYASGLGARFGDLLFTLADSGLAWDFDCLQYRLGCLQHPFDLDCVKLIWVGMIRRPG